MVLATKFANRNTSSVELDAAMLQVFLYDNFVNGKVHLHWRNLGFKSLMYPSALVTLDNGTQVGLFPFARSKVAKASRTKV
jgi:hypothetical protein